MFLLLLLLILTPLLFFFFFTNSSKKATKLPKPYPIVGHLFALIGLTDIEIFEWLSSTIAASPTSTIEFHHPFGKPRIYTGNPATVEHILMTQFHIYKKGPHLKTVFRDVYGDSIVNVNGKAWKLQRQTATPDFTHQALQKFEQKTVKFEISERLIPILSDAAKNNKVIDLQDILQRFAFDTVCKVIFGFDVGYLSPSLPDDIVTRAFDEAASLCDKRYNAIFPIIWKVCKYLNIGSEKRLKHSVQTIREFIEDMIKSSKDMETEDQEAIFINRLLKDDRFDEKLIIDAIISFIAAGRDTISPSLAWFFWLTHKNNHVEKEIIREITNIRKTEKSTENLSSVEKLKEMTYAHAALSETMRLYPPIAVNPKEASTDDILPDGTKVKKGMIVGYCAHAMGRSEKIWGPDWAEFRPERWLREEVDEMTGETKQTFVTRDSYSYPVFHAGPRTCLGKEMAYLQMKSIIAAVLSRFKVVQAGLDPVYVLETTATMRDGFLVRIQERDQVD